MLFSLFKFINARLILPIHHVLFFKIFLYQMMHRVNHVFGNVKTNMIVIRVSISMNNKTCSMFSEGCTTGRIESSGNTDTNVIWYRKNHRECIHLFKHQSISFLLEPVTICSSTLTTVVEVTTSTMESMYSRFPSPPLLFSSRNKIHFESRNKM